VTVRFLALPLTGVKAARPAQALLGRGNQGSPMPESSTPPTPSSLLALTVPVLRLGLRPAPLWLLQPALDLALAGVLRRHPGLFERLHGFVDGVIVIDPGDLPLVFVLDIAGPRPRIRLARSDRGLNPAATIRGAFATLIDLLEGRLDGDALFFTRELVIEGDTEAVVALRNAVDNAEIDVLADVLSVLGPFAGPAVAAARGFEQLALGALGEVRGLRDRLLPAPGGGPARTDARGPA